MTHRTLQTVLRKLADTGPPESDADLLLRFAADRDEAAFTQMVQRHGRLVWAVCRHLTRSDAEADDAFQATFLVLVRNAGKVRDAGKLSAWLHGVAYKVCSKARQSAKRRTTREAVTAKPERNGTAVPDSAWDRALTAVHEEVAQLPDTLRVPFVLCCLEGKGQTEAAEQLGWKLGTLSSRLTRAKDAVLAKLDARGLTLGVVATVGLTTPPSAVTAKAAALVHAGCAVPGAILQLSQGVIGMSVNQVKLLAAGLLVACGLGLSGYGWLNTADAQYAPPGVPLKPAERVKQLEEELAKAKKEAESATLLTRYTEMWQTKSDKRTTLQTAKWEYDFAEMAETFDAANLALFLQEREKAGWEFLGSSALARNGGVPMWLFRKPRAATANAGNYNATLREYRALGDATKPADPTAKPGSPPAKPADPAAKADDWSSKSVRWSSNLEDPAAIDAEIKRLQDLRRSLQNEVPPPQRKELAGNWTRFSKADLPLGPVAVADLLRKLGEKKFGPDNIEVKVANDQVIVYGGSGVSDWTTEMVKKLADK